MIFDCDDIFLNDVTPGGGKGQTEKGKKIIDACVGKMMEYLKAREMV